MFFSEHAAISLGLSNEEKEIVFVVAADPGGHARGHRRGEEGREREEAEAPHDPGRRALEQREARGGHALAEGRAWLGRGRGRGLGLGAA